MATPVATAASPEDHSHGGGAVVAASPSPRSAPPQISPGRKAKNKKKTRASPSPPLPPCAGQGLLLTAAAASRRVGASGGPAHTTRVGAGAVSPNSSSPSQPTADLATAYGIQSHYAWARVPTRVQ